MQFCLPFAKSQVTVSHASFFNTSFNPSYLHSIEYYYLINMIIQRVSFIAILSTLSVTDAPAL